MPASASDADLVRAARTDPEAFEALYRQHLPAIYRYVRARVDSVESAEDVTASTFVAALAGLERYEEQGRFTAWLYTIARRQVGAHLRTMSQRAAPDRPGRAGPHWAPDAQDRVERMDTLPWAMAALTEDRRDALALRYFADLPVAEVARVLGKGESATKMLIHRGLAQLRDILSETDGD